MGLTWLQGAREELATLDESLRSAVESEAATMFADSAPAAAFISAPSILTVELPCGVEIDFEEAADGCRIVHVAI
jgi:hypothetical protein